MSRNALLDLGTLALALVFLVGGVFRGLNGNLPLCFAIVIGCGIVIGWVMIPDRSAWLRIAISVVVAGGVTAMIWGAIAVVAGGDPLAVMIAVPAGFTAAVAGITLGWVIPVVRRQLSTPPHPG